MEHQFTTQMPLPFVERVFDDASTDGQTETKTGVTTPAANPPRGSILTLEEIKQMTTAEVTARWAEVAAVLSINN
jgi:hypothetical protein